MTVSIRISQWGGYKHILTFLDKHPAIHYHFTPKLQSLVFESISDFGLWNHLRESDEREDKQNYKGEK